MVISAPTVVICAQKNCRGAVLAVALLFLVILTMLGISVMSIGQQELKMGGQFQQQSLVHERAEACLKVAEMVAQNIVDAQLNIVKSPFRASPGLRDSAAETAPAVVSDPAFWADPAQSRSCGIDSRYVIEYLGVSDIVTAANRYTGLTQSMHSFRITAHGRDTTSDTQVFLQTIYLRNTI